MRFVIYGAGAVGGVIGGRLSEAGEDVVLIARGAHHDAIRERGLTVVTDDGDPEVPDGRRVTLAVPVVDHPSRLTLADDDVVLLAMKTQHTDAALDDLRAVAPPDITVVCAQNGVENERLALRRFARVQAMLVICPTGHLEPGVVEAYAAPVTGILDLGRYPTGTDDVTGAIAAALERATFRAEARGDIMRWKVNKLLMNLPNAVQALCPPGDAATTLSRLARAEGERVLDAAGVAFVDDAEEQQRRTVLVSHRAQPRSPKGGSTWQSLARGTGNVETDHLNGEIVLLARLHGVTAPVNEVLQRHIARAARERRRPGSTDAAVLLAEAGAT
jgi:2-dehydropantoate 2-reductase